MAKLERISLSTRKNYVSRIKTVILLILLSSWTPLFSQQKITGKVLDANTQEVIVGANVAIKSSNEGSASDSNGLFELVTNQKIPLTLEVTYLGYKTQEIDVYEADELVTILLNNDYNALNQVVVVGYGTQKRKELTGAVTTVAKSTLSQPVVSFDNLLGGAVAGLNISQNGQPGATFSARIRGGNSINAGNEPLFVVDGVILYGTGSTSSSVSQVSANINPLAAINPNDIESIDVLKDVSATAIYGSRGSNGVIIITTKNGRKGAKDRIEYQYSIGWQQATKTLDLLNASEWAALNREIGGALKGASDAEIAAFGEGYDWQNSVLRTAANQSHQFSFNGGDDKTRYSLSGNYTNQDGILLNTDFKRYTGRLNLERDILKNLTVSLILNASKLNQNGLNGYPSYAYRNSPFDDAFRTSPAVPIYNADGSYNYANPYEVGDLRAGDRTTNAVSNLLNTTAQNHANTLLGNFSIRYTIIPSLVLKVAAGTNINNATSNYYAPSYTAGGFTANGYASVGNRRTDIWQYEYTLNYTKQLSKDHYIDALAGYTNQTTYAESATAAATNFANDLVLWHSLQSGNNREAPSSSASEARLNSYIGRVNYTFKGRYNLTATIRADGSSRFAPNHRWGYFPSVGVSWNVSDEAFLKNNRTLNALKLRASLGTVGNQEIGNYQYDATYTTTSPYSFNNQLAVGYVRSRPENPDLKWEQTAAYNVGIDAGFFNYRLNITAEAYYKKTSDLLLSTPTSIGTGFSSVLRNVGNISNKGIELEVSGTIIDKRKLKWTVSGNIAKNINKVLKLAGDQENIGSTIWIGHPLSIHYYIVYDGIVQTGEDVSEIAGPSWKTTVEPGDEKFVNQTDVAESNPVVDEANDRVILGTSNPDVIYGFSTSFSYKDLSLDVSFQGVSGNKIYNSLRQTLSTPNISYNGLAELNNRWTESNPSTEIPKARTSAATYQTSRFLEDGAFLRLKNVTVSYNLPVKIAAAPSAKFRIFLAGQNLLTFTKFTGFDPETGGGTAYPLARTISLGVNLSY
ncbi:MAG: TonB-dependent receptor [Prevotellaceae bacterium]|jgi:TonB-linked SusC/RagA family outer membrane protein|nr:TonB-dependent receptor [Prevotellaceae bacterium]